MSSEAVIRAEDLSKCYRIYDRPRDRLFQMIARKRKRYYRDFWALNKTSFEVKRGESVGIIGRNGSGKSTLLQLVCGILSPTTGSISTYGRVAALLELGAGFNPDFTGRENVYMNAAVLGLSRGETDRCFEQIEAFADIGDFIDQPVKTYSSGMFVRLAFAVQVHIEASIVVIDEALAVGDVFFRQKCYARLDQLRNAGVAILLVSHSMPDIEQYCERAILLDHGTPQFIGPASEASKRFYLLQQEREHEKAIPNPVSVADESPAECISRIANPLLAGKFSDIGKKRQVSNGQARCTGIVICDSSDRPCNSFRQGESAIFYYEFEVSESFGVPICGIVISNDRRMHVYGKCNWQYDNDTPSDLVPGGRILCRQEVKLDLEPGEYVFEIGLGSVSLTEWRNRRTVSQEEFASSHKRVCLVPEAGTFSVGVASRDGVSVLTHYGIANLPGSLEISLLN